MCDRPIGIWGMYFSWKLNPGTRIIRSYQNRTKRVMVNMIIDKKHFKIFTEGG